jgi:hypothetical protein
VVVVDVVAGLGWRLVLVAGAGAEFLRLVGVRLDKDVADLDRLDALEVPEVLRKRQARRWGYGGRASVVVAKHERVVALALAHRRRPGARQQVAKAGALGHLGSWALGQRRRSCGDAVERKLAVHGRQRRDLLVAKVDHLARRHGGRVCEEALTVANKVLDVLAR